MWVLDYNSLFMVFSFAWGSGFQSTWGCTGLFSQGGMGWVGESHMVHDAHLYFLQFYLGSFGDSCQGEMASFGVA
jgi:hypothetical protein